MRFFSFFFSVFHSFCFHLACSEKSSLASGGSSSLGGGGGGGGGGAGGNSSSTATLGNDFPSLTISDDFPADLLQDLDMSSIYGNFSVVILMKKYKIRQTSGDT